MSLPVCCYRLCPLAPFNITLECCLVDRAVVWLHILLTLLIFCHMYLFHCFSCLSSSWSSRHNCLNTLYSAMARYSHQPTNQHGRLSRPTHCNQVVLYIAVTFYREHPYPWWNLTPCPYTTFALFNACEGVCLHKDQLHEDPLGFKQNSSYGLFWCFHYSFSYCYFLVVNLHHDHPSHF